MQRQWMESINESHWTFTAVGRFGVVCPGAGTLEPLQLASPPWSETTHALQSCRKREKHLKFYWSPVQRVPSTPFSMTGPSPLTSPHFVFLSIFPILSLISHFIVFDTSSALPALSSCLTLFLHCSKSFQLATCGKPDSKYVNKNTILR